MAEYANSKKVRWYEDIPCPFCGAERTNSWEKRISRALGYRAIVCEDCIAKEYGLTVAELRALCRTTTGCYPVPAYEGV